jgi:hypothetical protein
MNPSVDDFSLLPQVSTFNYPEGRRLRVIFPRDPTKTDITIEVQVATDLTLDDWSTIASSVNGAPITGVGYVDGDGSGAGIKQVEVRDTVNIVNASPPHRFMRLRITHARQ